MEYQSLWAILFALDQTHFEEQEDNTAGLGPVYSATSCVTCHQNRVTGGPSEITELRVGHNNANGNVVNPTVFINDGQDSVTAVDGGTFIVPEALGNKVIHPFGDYLLHDVGTGDGIVQTKGLQETANKMRTARLWGLRMRTRFMHCFESLSPEGAIRRHRGEARQVTERFRDLSPTEKQQLITFLGIL